MEYHRFPSAAASRAEPSTSRPSGSGGVPFSGTNPRTSSKRSFDEYGHLESQSTSQAGPSGSSSMMTTPTTSMVGAATMLGLGNNASIGNHFGDPVNTAHNARHKRRRGSLSPPQAEISLHTPSMPAGTSLSTSGTPNQRITGHSASNSAESLMSWLDDASPQSASQQSANQMTSQTAETPSFPNRVHNTLSRNLAQPANSGDGLFEARPEGDFRDNRMSWMPETNQPTETVTTNTEPGWNFGLHDHNPSPAMDFPMPHAQSADALSQQFLERSSYDSTDETNGPPMPVPSFQPDTRPAASDLDNHTNANPISPRSQASIYMDSWYRSHQSRRTVPPHPIVPPSPDSPAPTGWRSPPPLEPPRIEAAPWWPNRWNYLDGALSPPPPTMPRPIQDRRQNPTSNRPPASTLPSNAAPDYRNTPVQISRPAFPRPWDAHQPPSPSSHWPPYHVSPTSESTTTRTMFPEPQFPGENGGRNNAYTSYPRDEHHMHRSAPPRGFHDISPTMPSSSGTAFSTIGGRPPASSASRAQEPPSSVTSSVRPPANLYSSDSDRGVRFRDESARSRTSARIPSPPPARRSFLALQDILDRQRGHLPVPGIDTNMRPSHLRSTSDASPVGPYHSHSPTEVQQRRAERLSEWRDSTDFSSGETRGIDGFGPDRSIGPSGSAQPNSRPGARNRLSNSFYDHPSMRDLVSNHSANLQERERRELHSTLARPAVAPPAPRRTLSGLLDYTRGVAGFGMSAHLPGRSIPPPSPTRAPLRSNSPVSSRPFPPAPSSRRPPSPASRPSPFSLDPFSRSSPTEPNERPSEPSRSMRTRRDRRRDRDSRMGRLLGAELPLAWLGSDEDFPFYDHVNLEDRDLGGLSATAERMRPFGRFRARRAGAVQMGNIRALGDYVMDDDFDDSYEGLMALSQIVGPVKRGCSEDTLGGLPAGTYAEFAAGSSENSGENKVLGDNGNCAICLEDYVPMDMCTKLPRCLHFYHRDCVKEWLKTAKTCPVCRENVEGPPRVKGNSRPARVRFVPISEGQRDGQNPALQHLRDTSGPSTSGLGARIPVPNGPRRRSMHEPRAVPPHRNMFESEQGRLFTASGLERLQRLRVPPFDATRVEPTSMIGEFDDAWPSPPSPTSSFALFHRGSPSPPPWDGPGASVRFGRGPLARAFDEFLPSRI